MTLCSVRNSVWKMCRHIEQSFPRPAPEVPFNYVKEEVEEPFTAPPPWNALGTLRTKESSPVREAEAVTLSGLETEVARVKVRFHLRGKRRSYKHLRSVGNVSLDEERIRILETLVHKVTVGNHPLVIDGVDIVISGVGLIRAIQHTVCRELISWRNVE